MAELDHELSGTIGSAWADSTLKTRNSQWKRFIGFCHDNDLIPLPATHHTVARFLVFQSRTSKYSTVNNYVSAINKLHQFYGHNVNFRESFLVKLTLAGIKRQLGDFVHQKIPLTPEQLKAIYDQLDMSDASVSTMWCAIILSFRTLLRKSNIVPETLTNYGHVLLRRDVDFTSNGLLLRVNSSKTIQYKDRVLEIPLSKVDNPAFCVVTMLHSHFLTTSHYYYQKLLY